MIKYLLKLTLKASHSSDSVNAKMQAMLANKRKVTTNFMVLNSRSNTVSCA